MHISLLLFVKSQLSCQIDIYERKATHTRTSTDNKKNKITGHGEEKEEKKRKRTETIIN